MEKDHNQWLSVVREIAARNQPTNHQREILFYGASNFYFWQEMAQDLSPWPVLNHGFGGSTDPDLVLFADELLYPYAPKLVFLQTGSNDYVMREGTDAEKIAACMAYKREMLSAFRKHLPDTEFVVMSGLQLPGRSQYRALTQEINRQLCAWAREESWLHFVDADAMTWNGTEYRCELFVEDMIHLNHEGQLRWARDYILPVIRQRMNLSTKATPSPEAKAMNDFFASLPHDSPDAPHDYEAERRQGEAVQPPAPPEGVRVEEDTLSGLYAEWVTKPGNDHGLIFYIHGGGFCTGSATMRRDMCQYMADVTGYNTVAFNYRLSPENKWPAHLDDCVAAYRAVLAKGYSPETIVLMGESAGGTLVLSLALCLKELGLPQPRAVVSLSPCVSQADLLPSHTANIATDTMLRDAVARQGASVIFPEGTTGTEMKASLASPLYGDFEGLPPIFLAASDAEVLYDDTLLLYGRLMGAGHPVAIDIQLGVCHAYPIFPALPEAKATIQKALHFADALCQSRQ